MNPLVLKADLVATGVTVTDGLQGSLRLGGLPGAAVDLALPQGVVASVPVLASGEEAGAYRLLRDRDGTILERPAGAEHGSRRIPVHAEPLPAFYARQTSRGTPMHRIAERRGRVLVVTPLGRCGYSIAGHPCTFCIEGGRSTTAPGTAASLADVIETLGAARREAPIDVVLFNTDSVEGDDGGVAFLAPYVQAVRRHARVLVAAHLHPPRTTAWVDRTYALGLDAISYALEIFDADAFGRLCVGRARYIGRERYLDMLARATSVFPRGAVWSELVVGVEPAARTAAGIEALAAMGVVPVLAIPRGPHGLPHLPPPEELARLIAHLAETTLAHRVPITWVRELGASITPADALADAGGASRGGRLGATIAVRGAQVLSRLRRRLRVRPADTASPPR